MKSPESQITELDLSSRTPTQDVFDMEVRRHVDCVYAAALRQVRDPQLAADVTQAVFLIFQRKRGAFGPETVVLAWLLRTTRYTCLAALHQKRQRIYHERKASIMRPEVLPPPVDDPCGLFDAALNDLRKTDRTAIVLTYFEGLTHKQLAVRLGISEQAAHKRVRRAVEKLKNLMRNRNSAFRESSVVQLLATAGHPAAAPAAITHAVLVTGGKTSTSIHLLVKGASFMMKMLKAKIVAVLLLSASAAAVLGMAAYRSVSGQSPPTTVTIAQPSTMPAPPLDAPVPLVVDATAAQIAEARAAVIARQAKFQNFSVEYEMQYDNTPAEPILRAMPPPQVPKEVQDAIQKQIQDQHIPGLVAPKLEARRTPAGVSFYQGTFSVLDSRIISEIVRSDADALRARAGVDFPFSPETWIITPQRVERMDRTSAIGQILAPNLKEFPLEWTVDLGLGLRGLDSNALFIQKEWSQAQVHLLADKTWEFMLPSHGQSSEQWIFDPAQSFALTRYRIVQNNTTRHEVVCFNFKAFSGVTLPTQMVRRQFEPSGGKPSLWMSFALTINKYAFNDPANTPDRYQMIYRSGDSVIDIRTGKSIDNNGPDRSFTDEEFAKELQLQHPPTAPVP